MAARLLAIITAFVKWRFSRHAMVARNLRRRVNFLRQHAAKDALGIEIAPWCWPIIPKKAGYNSRSIDLFDTDELRQRAVEVGVDKNISDLEPVDFVGNAASLAEVMADYGCTACDYIISSHNFEHLPDPLRFLQACGRVLPDGGILTMAVPDKRATFDYFRPVSTTGDFIQAFFEQRTQPTAAQLFAQDSMQCRYLYGNDDIDVVFDVADNNPAAIIVPKSIEAAFAAWEQARAEGGDARYRDCHCSTFTPASFKLIILDLYHLGLSDFMIEDSTVLRAEFGVHLRKDPKFRERADYYRFYYERRPALLKAVIDECAENAPSVWPARRLQRLPKWIGKQWRFKP